ncbi:MAG: ABC transporter permease subunit, partial [Pseudomonadota bacterium]
MYPDPNRKRRFGWLDAVLIALALGALAYAWTRVSDVLVYRWDWGFLPQVLFKRDESSGWLVPNVLLEGLLTTIRLSIWAMILASALGLAFGLMSTARRLLPRLTALAYVGVVRNVPPLVFIFVFYFFISSQILPALGVDVWARGLDETGRAAVNLLLGPPDLFENLVSGVLCLA